MKAAAFLFVMLASAPAMAQNTPCTFTDWISILQVFITPPPPPPKPIYQSQYDLETKNLWVTFTDKSANFFVGVPQSQAVGQPKWPTIASNHEAVMQERATCPLMYQDGAVIWSK